MTKDFEPPRDPEIESAERTDDESHAFNKVAFDFTKYCLEPRVKEESERFRRLLSETVAIGNGAILFDKVHPCAVPGNPLNRNEKLSIVPPVGVLFLNWEISEELTGQELTIEAVTPVQRPDRLYSEGSGYAFVDGWRKKAGHYVKHIQFSESPSSKWLTPINLNEAGHVKNLKKHCDPIYRVSVYLGVGKREIHKVRSDNRFPASVSRSSSS